MVILLVIQHFSIVVLQNCNFSHQDIISIRVLHNINHCTIYISYYGSMLTYGGY